MSQPTSPEYHAGDYTRTLNGRPVDLESGSTTRDKAFPKNAPRPLRLKDRVVRITWSWFPCTMSTGGLANLLNEQPYTFTGLKSIGKIFFILNIILFLIFTALITARFAMKPRAFSTSLHHPSESFFFGAFWVSIALILTGAQSYGGPETGEWFTTAMRVVFWIYYAFAGLMGQGLGWMLALFIYAVYLSRLIQHKLPDASKRPGMFIAVGPTAFTCGGLIALGTQAKSALPDDFLGTPSIPAGELWSGMSVAAGLFIWLMAIWFSALSAISVLRAARRMEFSLSWWALVFPNVGLALATINVGNTLSSRGIKIFGSALTVVLVIVWFICAAFHIRAIVRRDLLAVGKDLDVEHVNKQHDRKAEKSKD
ncbi:Malic acid transport [Fusarium acutatum]|uniref:Malic acid transport n=1 Tax=Fusarium acutatum TaxID=78861 RepID=A0A8H4NNG0_9HYPO|nr:Malic acid transport [Fusarium acutatum]